MPIPAATSELAATEELAHSRPDTEASQPGRSGRATPLPRDERRALLVEVTVPLLRLHGREVTTRQIAEAAGVAEGTIFRAFDSKDELVDEALRSAFAPGRLLDRLRAVDVAQPLRERLVDVVRIVQTRFIEVFSLMDAVGMIEPPDRSSGDGEEEPSWRGQTEEAIRALVEPDRDRLRVTPTQLVRLVRLLTFSGSHTGIADGELLTPEEIVDVLLHGTCLPGPGGPDETPAATTTASGDLTC